jgi:DNA topoisomerase II
VCTQITNIIDDFYNVRIDTYAKRKDHMISQLETALYKLSNKALYIELVLNDKIDLRRKNFTQIDDLLLANKLGRIDNSYDYLVKMAMNSVSQEHVDKLIKEKGDNELELQHLQNTTVQKMWLNELENFEVQYNKYKLKRNSDYESEITSSTKVKKIKLVKK